MHERDVKPHSSNATQSTVIGKLNHFIRGGSLTAGGMMHAVTSVAQTLPDADAAHDLESQALRVLQLTARQA